MTRIVGDLYQFTENNTEASDDWSADEMQDTGGTV